MSDQNKKQVIYDAYGYPYPVYDYKKKCECGSKFTSNPDYHLDFCPLYVEKKENTNHKDKK